MVGNLFKEKRTNLVFTVQNAIEGVGYVFYEPSTEALNIPIGLFSFDTTDLYSTLATEITGRRIHGSGNSSSYTNALDEDFDTSPFTLSVRCKGTAILRLPWNILANPSDDWSVDFDIYLYRVRNSVETELGTGGATTSGDVTGAGGEEYCQQIAITLTETTFVPGDILRLTIIGKVKYTDGATTMYLAVACDPSDSGFTASAGGGNQTFSAGNSRMVLMVPWKIEQ